VGEFLAVHDFGFQGVDPIFVMHFLTIQRWVEYARQLHFAMAAQEVLVGGKHVPLTTIEYNLLAYLLKKAGEICPKDQILKQIWGTGYETCLHYVHLYIGRLRRKIERAPSRPEYLISVYGKGYCFQLSDASAQ